MKQADGSQIIAVDTNVSRDSRHEMAHPTRSHGASASENRAVGALRRR